MSDPRTAAGGMPKIAGVPMETGRMPAPDLEPLSLVDEEPAAAPASNKIRAFGVAQTHGSQFTSFKRKTHVGGQGAIRVRTFHGRLSDDGLAYMDDKINEWLDGHPEIEIKQVTTTVGLYDGKIKEQALIVNVWY